MTTQQKQIKAELEEKKEYLELKEKVLAAEIEQEVDITQPNRAIENNLLAWVYRLKKKGLFYRKDIRKDKIFLIRYK